MATGLYGWIEAAFFFLERYYPYFGLAGGVAAALVVGFTGLAYRGKRKERYSVFNHYISELGEVGVSRYARVFNAGLVVAGMTQLPYIAGLTLAIGNLWAFLGAAAGLVTGVACAMVGVFPMNDLASHTKAAMTFFRAGLVMMLLYSIAIAIPAQGESSVPKLGLLFSLLGLVAYLSFLILVRGGSVSDQIGDFLNPDSQKERPVFWALPAVEWTIFFTTILWFFGVAGLILIQ
jgi:hypothetical membrane protein